MPIWNKTSPYEKVEWLKRHFKWLLPNEHIFLTGNKKKLDGKNRVLYDDNLKFLHSWKIGTPVVFDQVWNKDFKGYRVNTHDEFYELIHMLENEEIIKNWEEIHI